MRPLVYATLFQVPLREAARRLEALAAREARELVRLVEPRHRAHAESVIAEIQEEARRLRALPSSRPPAPTPGATATKAK